MRLSLARHVHVVVNYREKQARAQAVVDQIGAAGGVATALKADLTDEHQVDVMFRQIREQLQTLDILILSASGGMERDVDAAYALRLNRDAQLAVLDQATPRMSEGGRVVFVTSHQAHFHGRTPTFAACRGTAARRYEKLASVEGLRRSLTDHDNVSAIPGRASLTIDTSQLDAVEAATQIIKHYGLPVVG